MKNKIIKATAKAPMLGVFAVVGVMMLTFQNCSKVNFAANQISNAEFSSSTQMTINNGAKYTNLSAVKVQFKVPTAVDVYVTNDSTCTTGGTWQELVPELPWHLGQLDQTATVYAKFRAAGGAELPCVSARIIHDDQAPVVSFTKFPAAYSNSANEILGVTGTDNISGIDHFECMGGSATTYTTCSEAPTAAATADGPYVFKVRAIDRAGNFSQAVNKSWILDRTAPTISFNSYPAASDTTGVAQFTYTANDVTSGVDHIMCSIDGAVAQACGLNSVNYTMPLLSNGTHKFAVVAYDKAGNASAPANYQWSVSVLAGSFTIIGVTAPGGKASDAGFYLGGSLNPVVYWSAAVNAVSYAAKISAAGTTTVKCSVTDLPATATPSYSFGTACGLQDGASYDIDVTALSANGALTPATTYRFKVDNSGPVIAISTPTISADQKTVTLSFTAVDTNSGLQSTTCSLTSTKYSATPQVFPCSSGVPLVLQNVDDGPHVFKVVATDKAGNSSTATKSFDTDLIICNPFIGVDAGCVKGLQANLYYLPTVIGTSGKPEISGSYKGNVANVDDYFTYGTRADAQIYMSDVFVPTRSFQNGFNAVNNQFVTDNSNNKLTAFFALDLQTVYKLASDETAGYYQFGLISDDGAVLQTMINGQWVDYVNNNQYSSSTFVCDMQGMYLDTNSRVQMRIKYFQGPPDEIALVLVVHKLAGAPTTANLTDEECQPNTGNKGLGGGAWFGPNLNDYTSTKYRYGSLLTRGWRTPVQGNFELNQAK